MFQHASGNKEDYYGSIEGQTLPGNNDVPVDDVTSTTDTASKMKKFAKYALIVAIGSSAMYALSFSRPRSSTEVPTLATTNDVTNSADHLALPDYLVALDSTDPEYDESMLTSKYVIGEPGQGNMIPGEVELVRFVKEHFVFRTYGGGAKQCGYWWVLNPPKGSKETYFDHFAICPEWNDADNIVRCRVPVNYTAVVGIGQTVTCPSGEYLDPDPSNLQLNGNICAASVAIEGHLSCEYCVSNDFNLRFSKCSNNGPDYIDGFSYSGN